MVNKIVMDSSGDIKTMEEFAFSSVPLKIIAGEKEFIDNEALNTEELVNYLKTYQGKVSTSCPSLAEYIEAFSGGDNIYVITISGALSGSCNTAQIAAESYMQEHPECKIHVFDSLSAGPEMLLIAEKIKSLVKQNLTFNEIVTKTKEYQKTTGLLFCLKSLHNLANNGRISVPVAKVVGALGIHMIGVASGEGKLQPVGKARGDKKVVSEIFKTLTSMGYSGGKIRISHCFNESAALNLKQTILSLFPNCDISIYQTGGLCSFYAEIGGILVGFEK